MIDISIHAPAWGTTSSAAAAGPIRSCFNPRAHVGRDTFTLFRINEIMSVSIHAPAWGATLRAWRFSSSVLFQSTRPRGARPDHRLVRILGAEFQSTHPRGARRHPVFHHAGDTFVSIHAPAWGATFHTYMYLVGSMSFNPRARVGRDVQDRKNDSSNDFVSIHAPAWGATKCDMTHQQVQFVSIHAPAWGATDALSPRMAVNGMFQSTRPRGARHRDDQRQPAAGRVSIHAPAWGATRCRAPFRPGRLRFNPRARVGRDRIQIYQKWEAMVSIHAPAWGATVSS